RAGVRQDNYPPGKTPEAAFLRPVPCGCTSVTGGLSRRPMSARHEIALTPTEQREFLASALTMTLASVDQRGYPHLVAMWFVVDPDGTVFMTTYAKSQKAMNLRRDPRCTLLVERGTRYDQLQGVMIRGRATLEPDVERTLDVLPRIPAKHRGE